MSYLIVGMTAPNSLSITISNSPMTDAQDQLDLSGLTYCRLLVRKPTGTADVFWEATTVTPSADSVTVVYEFESGDLSEAGSYIIKPRLSATPFYSIMFSEPGVEVKTELNPTNVRYCSNVDVEVLES